MEYQSIIMDFERSSRCAIEEAVFCEFKTVDQIEQILTLAKQNNKTLLLTRLNQEKFLMLCNSWQMALTYHSVARCAVLGDLPSLDNQVTPLIAIVSAGSSDAYVCQEALLTLNYHGITADLYQDMGVAGLWRILDKQSQLKQYSIIIAVAGMEAALPTVLAGLVDAPIIAVPTAIGYGVSAGGQVALQACLSSCAGGVMTVNIDNGYGSACAAIKMYRKMVKS